MLHKRTAIYCQATILKPRPCYGFVPYDKAYTYEEMITLIYLQLGIITEYFSLFTSMER